MDLFAQLPAVVGVVVGVAMSYIVTSLTERSKWRRQVSIRWDERRLAAYIEYVNSIKMNSMIVARILAGRGQVKTISPLSAERGLLELSDAETDRSVGFEGVLMLGDSATIDAGMALNKQVWKMQAFARGELEINPPIWHDAFTEYRRLRIAFYRASRRSMGIASADVGLESAWLGQILLDVERAGEATEGSDPNIKSR